MASESPVGGLPYKEFHISESYGFLSTYPPTQCGLATFTASLARALSDRNGVADRAAEVAGATASTAALGGGGVVRVGVVRVVERAERRSAPEVVHQLITTIPGGEAAAAEALNQYGVAIVQHEYGIYGGPDGDSVIGILRRLRVPSIVVLHTVLAEPSSHQRQVLEQVVEAASVVVVMTDTARRRLLDGYSVDSAKVVLIAHGAPTDWGVIGAPTEPGPPQILTWGLLGPGKGIEWAIGAVAALADLDPQPSYVVAGETHPHVLERDGEAYRNMLSAQAGELGISHLVRFVNRYLDRPALRKLVLAADVVVLPYDSTDQVTSGVLIEAITAGRPVVATAFPHANELLSSGAGIVVPHRNPAAIAAAVRSILEDPATAAAMVKAGRKLIPGLTWAAVGEQYRALARSLRPDMEAQPSYLEPRPSQSSVGA